MEEIPRKKILTLLGIVAAFIGVIVIISVVLMNLDNNKFKVIIKNVGECSDGISGYSKDVLFGNAYKLVKEQNNIEGKYSIETYEASFREGSCKTETYNGTDNIVSYDTSAILDIEELGYSYQVEYSWVKDNVGQDIDLGSMYAMCLNPGDLIFGDFDCESNPMVMTEMDLDPILSILPYFGDHYTIQPAIDGDGKYKIVVEYDPPESVYLDGDLGTYVAERKQSAIDYLKEQGIELENYKLEETYYYVH